MRDNFTWRIIKNIKKKILARKKGQAAAGERSYQSLLSKLNLLGTGDLQADGAQVFTTEAEKAQSLIAQAGTKVMGQAVGSKTSKKDIDNLLKAFSMREQELRAKKAAPGFSASRSMLG